MSIFYEYIFFYMCICISIYLFIYLNELGWRKLPVYYPLDTLSMQEVLNLAHFFSSPLAAFCTLCSSVRIPHPFCICCRWWFLVLICFHGSKFLQSRSRFVAGVPGIFCSVWETPLLTVCNVYHIPLSYFLGRTCGVLSVYFSSG